MVDDDYTVEDVERCLEQLPPHPQRDVSVPFWRFGILVPRTLDSRPGFEDILPLHAVLTPSRARAALQRRIDQMRGDQPMAKRSTDQPSLTPELRGAIQEAVESRLGRALELLHRTLEAATGELVGALGPDELTRLPLDTDGVATIASCIVVRRTPGEGGRDEPVPFDSGEACIAYLRQLLTQRALRRVADVAVTDHDTLVKPS